jgi:hypothetical protein
MAIANKKQSISWAGDVISVVYGHGETFTGDCASLPENVYQSCDAARHGIAQKLGDAKSGGTSREKIAEVREIWANLVAGEWNRKGEQGGIDAIMPEVFATLDASNAEAWTKRYLGLDEEGREKIRSQPAIKTAINKVKADRKLKEIEAGTEEFDPFA